MLLFRQFRGTNRREWLQFATGFTIKRGLREKSWRDVRKDLFKAGFLRISAASRFITKHELLALPLGDIRQENTALWIRVYTPQSSKDSLGGFASRFVL
jgi:hypothetical protein